MTTDSDRDEPDPNGGLPKSGMEAALESALDTTPRLPRDSALVQLALRYAEMLDDLFAMLVDDEGEAPEDGAAYARVVLAITRIGNRYEATLDRLGMSPSARPVVAGNGGDHGPTAEAREFQRLRADSAAGAPTTGLDYAASVDPAVTEAGTED